MYCHVGTPRRNAALRVFSHSFQPQAEVCALDKGIDEHDGKNRDQEGGRTQAGLRRQGWQPEGMVEGHGPGHGCNAGPLPRPEDQPEVQGRGHEVQAQPAEDFVHPAECLQRTGEHGPERAPHDAGKEADRDDQRRIHPACLQSAQRPCREYGTEGDLPFDADVPQPDGKCEEKAGRCQEQGHPGDKDVRDDLPGADGAENDVRIRGKGRRLGSKEDQCREEQGQEDGPDLDECMRDARFSHRPPLFRNCPSLFRR